MACQDDVPGVARQGGIGDVADRTLQDVRRIALHHDDGDPDARNFDHANGVPVSHHGYDRSGCNGRALSGQLELPTLRRLIHMRVDRQICGIGEREDTGGQQDARRVPRYEMDAAHGLASVSGVA